MDPNNVDQTFDDAFEEISKAAGDKAGTVVDGEEPKPTETAKPKEVPAAAPELTDAEKAEAAEKAEFERLRNEKNYIEHRARTDSGRIDALSRKIQEMERARPAAPVVPPAPTATETAEAESWKRTEEEYPDLAKAVESRVQSQAERIREEVRAETRAVLQPIVQDAQQARQQRYEDAMQAQEDVVEKAHPGWKQEVKSAKFNDWVNTQPPLIRSGLASNNAADAILVISQFKSATQSTSVADIQKRREQRLAQAATVTEVSRAAPPGRQEIPDDFDAAWDHFDRQSARR